MPCFPTGPYSFRIDGHAAIANQQALDIARLKPGDKLEGGEIEVKDGKLTGILVDNAVDWFSAKFPLPPMRRKDALMKAAELFAVGLTGVHDCGLDYDAVEDPAVAAERRSEDADVCDAERQQEEFRLGLQQRKIKTDRLTVSGFKVCRWCAGIKGAPACCNRTAINPVGRASC